MQATRDKHLGNIDTTHMYKMTTYYSSINRVFIMMKQSMNALKTQIVPQAKGITVT
jgi:hypothetical protein